MRRRKRADAEPHTNGTAVAEPPVIETQPPKPDAPKNRPSASFAANSDKTTRVEVAVWGRTVEKDGESWIQFSVTVNRSYRKDGGTWEKCNFFRGHDIPIMQSLVARAYEWVLGQRIDVRIDDSVPF
jgi:hypothetical protein